MFRGCLLSLSTKALLLFRGGWYCNRRILQPIIQHTHAYLVGRVFGVEDGSVWAAKEKKITQAQRRRNDYYPQQKRSGERLSDRPREANLMTTTDRYTAPGNDYQAKHSPAQAPSWPMAARLAAWPLTRSATIDTLSLITESFDDVCCD